MDANPQVVLEFKTKNMAYLLDVDTPEDIQKLGLQKTELDLGD
jgi:CTP:molybdopterin cytidylyltransferase MocA